MSTGGFNIDYVEEELLKLGFDGPKWGVPTKKLFDALCSRFTSMKGELEVLRIQLSALKEHFNESKQKNIEKAVLYVKATTYLDDDVINRFPRLDCNSKALKALFESIED